MQSLTVDTEIDVQNKFAEQEYLQSQVFVVIYSSPSEGAHLFYSIQQLLAVNS